MSEDSDNIDVAECRSRDIQVVTLPQVSSNSLADLAVALLMKAARCWVKDIDRDGHSMYENSSTKSDNMRTSEISQSTVGIVGYGRVGRAVADRLRNIGVTRIIYSDLSPVSFENDTSIEFASFEDVIRDSDILCVCYKVTSSNVNLFNKDTFKMMKKRTILINLTKGEAINYHDLYNALKNEEITAAGLDVRETEEIPFKQLLVGLQNCFFYPYKESNTWDARRNLSVSLVTGIVNIFNSCTVPRTISEKAVTEQ